MPDDGMRDQGESDRAERFDRVTMLFHWASLLLVAALFATAWIRALAEEGGEAGLLLAGHRAIGLLLWGLTAARLAWRRWGGARPLLPESVTALQRMAARLTQYALCLLLLVQPLTGLGQSLARGRPFGLLVATMPAIVPRDRALTDLLHDLHEDGAWLLLGLIALHAAAALGHHFLLKDRVLRSMLPWARSARPAENFSSAGE